jgi:hypothetical protein
LDDALKGEHTQAKYREAQSIYLKRIKKVIISLLYLYNEGLSHQEQRAFRCALGVRKYTEHNPLAEPEVLKMIVGMTLFFDEEEHTLKRHLNPAI